MDELYIVKNKASGKYLTWDGVSVWTNDLMRAVANNAQTTIGDALSEAYKIGAYKEEVEIVKFEYSTEVVNED